MEKDLGVHMTNEWKNRLVTPYSKIHNQNGKANSILQGQIGRRVLLKLMCKNVENSKRCST